MGTLKKSLSITWGFFGCDGELAPSCWKKLRAGEVLPLLPLLDSEKKSTAAEGCSAGWGDDVLGEESRSKAVAGVLRLLVLGLGLGLGLAG